MCSKCFSQEERVICVHTVDSQVVLVVNAGDVRDVGSIPGLGKSPGGGRGNHSSILAWKIPRTEESGRLDSIGS